MAVRPQAIDVVIEELVLHGFDPADRLAIADAVEAELTKLIAAKGWTAPISLETVQAGHFRAADGRPASVGRETAKAVHRGLSSATASAHPPRNEGGKP